VATQGAIANSNLVQRSTLISSRIVVATELRVKQVLLQWVFPRMNKAENRILQSHRPLWWTAILLATMPIIALPAFAGLGEDVSSVQADQAHVQGSLRTTQTEAYTVHEIQAPTGTVVREYVSPTSGKVFAVAWQGPWPPDMRQILANYFAQFQQAAQAQVNSHAGRRPLVIEQSGFVMRSGGHMRSFAGHAYIPAMLPQGVSAEAIR
jgi:hypothetical protein